MSILGFLTLLFLPWYCGQRQPPLSGAPVNKMAVNYHEGETDPPDLESGGFPHLFGTFLSPHIGSNNNNNNNNPGAVIK